MMDQDHILSSSIVLQSWVSIARAFQEPSLSTRFSLCPSSSQLCAVLSHHSLWPHGLWPARLLCLWDSPGKNTGVGCHALLQGIFLNPGIEPVSLISSTLADGFFTTGITWEAPLPSSIQKECIPVTHLPMSIRRCSRFAKSWIFNTE